ncbi:MAG: hypothetical protein ACKPKO_51015 [Candidatus Fonsibacter sp.]
MKKTLGIRSNVVHNFDISGIEYRRDKLIIGIDCERVLESWFFGSFNSSKRFDDCNV